MITENLKQQVKEVFKNSNFNSNNIFQVLKKNPTIKQQLEEQFNTKPKIYNSIGKLVILICKDIQLKKCVVCGKQMSYDRTVDNKSHYCSNKCKLSEGFNPLHNGIKHPHWDDFSKQKQEAIQQKKKQTCLEKYGVENTSKLNSIKDKIKLVKQQHYGQSGQWGNKEIRNKMIKGMLDTTYERIVQKCKQLEYEPSFPKEEYLGNNNVYNWKCKKCGEIFQAKYSGGRICSRCFKCYPRQRSSSYEKELWNFLKQNNINYIQNDKNIIKPYELDIVVPDKNIAIQFNGTYWHSTKRRSNKSYHLNKTKMCESKGYKLIQIFEYDWIKQNKKQILKDKIKAILNIEQQSIYARKCQIYQITTKQKNEFLNNYHIQGEDQSLFYYGLKYIDQLVAVMTFGKPRFNKKYDWELIRYATKAGYRVIGGAGKLLKYFRNHYKGSIITYADRRYSNGNMYQKLGFELDHKSDPNYIWVNANNTNIILSRYQTQKHKLSSLLGSKFDPKLSQKQNMINNNFYQVFDCGNKVFILE